MRRKREFMAAVQALARAPVALPSPATSFTSLSTPMTGHWGAGALHQRLNAFVKKSLIQQLVPTGAVVSSFPSLYSKSRVITNSHCYMTYSECKILWSVVHCIA